MRVSTLITYKVILGAWLDDVTEKVYVGGVLLETPLLVGKTNEKGTHMLLPSG